MYAQCSCSIIILQNTETLLPPDATTSLEGCLLPSGTRESATPGSAQDTDNGEVPNDIRQMERKELLPASASQGMQYTTVLAAAGKTPIPVDSSVHYQEVDHKATKVTHLACSSTSTCN